MQQRTTTMSEEEIAVSKKKFFTSIENMITEGVNINTPIDEARLAIIPSIRGQLALPTTYLHAAVLLLEPEQVDFLLEHGANINALDGARKSALNVAILPLMLKDREGKRQKKPVSWNTIPSGDPLTKSIESCEILLQHGATLSRNEKVFLTSCLSKKIDLDSCQRSVVAREEVKAHLASGKDINALIDDRHTLLHQAVNELNVEKVIVLLRKGADLNVTDFQNKSPMQLMIDRLDEKLKNPKWTGRRYLAGGLCHLDPSYYQTTEEVLRSVEQSWKDIFIWLLRYGAKLDSNYYTHFATMNIDRQQLEQECKVNTAKLARRTELLNKKTLIDQEKMRQQLGELEVTARNNAIGFNQQILELQAEASRSHAEMQELKNTLLEMKSMMSLLIEDNQQLREDNQRLLKAIGTPRIEELPQEAIPLRLEYQREPNFPFFQRRGLLPPNTTQTTTPKTPSPRISTQEN